MEEKPSVTDDLTTVSLAQLTMSTAQPYASSLASNVKSISWDVATFWSTKLYRHLANASNPKAYYNHLLTVATNYEQWAEAASILDDIDGLNAWKQDPRSSDYDWELIQTRLDQLRTVRLQQSQSAMIFALRTSLARNLGDMGNPKLYCHSRVGTKDLISSYIDQVIRQLNWICDEPADEKEEPDLDLKFKHDFFMNIRQSFGRTALLLSGGGTLGLNHIGVIKCLHRARLLPRIISGASSGSIIAALVCTKTDEEIPHMFDPLSVKLDVFEREGHPDTPMMRLQRLLTHGQLYDVNILTEAMRANIGDLTFQEAFNRTRWILNITVSSSTLYDMPRLLNYLTAPDVLIWSAVAVSCAVPVFYGSSRLYAKDKNGNIVPWNPSDQLYIDGSVENDLPMNKLSELFNVNHFIVCQVNPHVIPFLQKTTMPSLARQAMNFCMHMAKTEVQHRCTQLTELGVMPSFFYKIQAIMSQKYSGDITIIPDVGYANFLKVLSNPTPETVAEAIVCGERATWPKMSIIKNHLQIELTIDAILYRLRLRRLNELSQRKGNGQRPLLENRAVSQLYLPTTLSSTIRLDAVQESDPPPALSVVVRSTKSTPMVVAPVPAISKDKRDRVNTKKNLLMTATRMTKT
ncbi:acyl transferase/acyl hydrolase/lysophospholipase [Radiomyces spectabilis]|uniref:acyl transferase/acyl hydrolase/lysophospholipase n=1 Tax=Radiomyces spectabilis TaxID=64574 RepID=UPI0022202D88|nr:acyl transferase/acyl hydrolase/lysophospholipase [Radiomyces spectabilis]KAI8364743.1 acyl transferase/acyl hydrolase/lysophospholipase [Radiomyces spectabilis]